MERHVYRGGAGENRVGTVILVERRKQADAVASALRISGEPQVIAYWCLPASIASFAAWTNAAGGSKSGKPCDRLIAPCRCATRVISRMRDSVNTEVRREVFGMFLSFVRPIKLVQFYAAPPRSAKGG
jgi:hypothetical protein